MKKVLALMTVMVCVVFSGVCFAYTPQDLKNGTLIEIYPYGRYQAREVYEWYDVRTIQMKEKFLNRKDVFLVSIIAPKQNNQKYDIVESITAFDSKRFEKKVILKKFYKNGKEIKELRKNCLKDKSSRWETYGRDDYLSLAVDDMVIFGKLSTYTEGGD